MDSESSSLPKPRQEYNLDSEIDSGKLSVQGETSTALFTSVCCNRATFNPEPELKDLI